jgi:hypothetical protein
MDDEFWRRMGKLFMLIGAFLQLLIIISLFMGSDDEFTSASRRMGPVAYRG